MSNEPVDALRFAMSKIGQPHQHHRHCAHNLTVDEQWEMTRVDMGDRKATDEEMNRLGFYKEDLVSITPEDWEIDVPELDWSWVDGGEDADA